MITDELIDKLFEFDNNEFAKEFYSIIQKDIGKNYIELLDRIKKIVELATLK